MNSNMKHLNAAGFLQAFLIFGLLWGGCASPNVNPTQAKANTGYVDFHADSLWYSTYCETKCIAHH